MDFGIQFFPDVGPAEKTGKDYWQEALDLIAICDELGYTHVRTVRCYAGNQPGVLFRRIPSSKTVKALHIIVLSVLERLVAPNAGIDNSPFHPRAASSCIMAHPK
jgi:hypothetical protein